MNLPGSVELEKAALGYAMLDPFSRESMCGVLEPDDFTLESHRRVWRVIDSLFEAGKQVDAVTIYEELDVRREVAAIGGLTFLIGLQDGLPEVPEVGGYIERLKGLTFRRRVAMAAYRLALQSCDELATEDDVRLSYESLGNEITQTSAKNPGPVSTSELIAQYGLDTLLTPRQHGAVKLPWPRLDESLGGLSAGQMIVLMAATSRGKTSLALQIATAAAMQSNTPVVWSMEMSKKAMFQKAVTQLSGVWCSKYRMTLEERDSINMAAVAINDHRIYLDTDARSVGAFVAGLRRVRARQRIGLAVVDYLQLIRSNSRASRAQQVSENSRALKLAAMDLDIPFVVLSQVDRGSVKGDGEIGLHSAKESGDIENDADVMLWIKSGAEFVRDFDTNCELHIGKQREGPKGFSIPMVFRPASQTFLEVGE